MNSWSGSVRAFGRIFFIRVCNGVFTTSSSSSSVLFVKINVMNIRKRHLSCLSSLYSGNCKRHLSSSSSSATSSYMSSWDSICQRMFEMNKVRPIWTLSPLCMGRRSEKIAARKGVKNAKKMKQFSKIGKELVSALKRGGPNPETNLDLANLLQRAKQLDIPKEVLDRNMKRASDKGQEAYVEKVYEVYGFAGVSMVVECLTDKITRSVADVRLVVRECGGKMADSGSVIFKFKRARVVSVKTTDVDKDKLFLIALDAGAEDIIEPPDYDHDDSNEVISDRYFKIVTSPENHWEILSKLREEGISFETDNDSELIPINPIEVDDESMELNRELMEKLLELDDVDAVYTDQK